MAQVGNVIFTISADLKNVQGQLRTLESNFNSSFARIQSIAKNFGGGLLQGIVGGLSAGAVTAFAHEVLNLADSLQNLSDQTGISTQLLSGIKSPLEEAGSSLDAFARGVFNLQKNLGNADSDTDKVAVSIKQLGLNLNDLRNSSPDEFIKKVTDALAKVENPVQRNTILFNLLGKSAKELGPAFQQLVGRFDELKSKGLTPDTVKLLDDVGDSLTRLKNEALVLGAEGVAGLLRFFGVFDQRGKLTNSLIEIEDEIKRIDAMLQRRQDLRSKGLGFFTSDDDAEQLKKRQALLDRQREIDEQLNALNGKDAAKTAPFKAPEDTSQIKKVQSAVDAYRESLLKAIETQEVQRIKQTQGEAASLKAAQAFDILAVKARILADAQREGKTAVLPPDFAKAAKDAEATLNGLGISTDQFSEKNIGALQQRVTAGADSLNDLELAFRNLKAVLDETRNSGITEDIRFGLTPEETQEALAAIDKISQETEAAKKNFDELVAKLRVGAIDQSTPAGKEKARIAGIELDFVETANNITKVGEAAGKSQEEIAAAVAVAWQKSLQEINNKTDEVTEFQRRAMERAFDAMADLTKDVLGGNIKSWEDFGLRVKKVIDDIAADWLTLQAKQLLVGPNFGQSGNFNVGGLLGQAANSDIFKSISNGIGTAGRFIASLFHEGGVVGHATAMRAVDPSVFAGARRYHTGLMPDEFPAILQQGERVIPKGGMQGGPVTQNISITFPNANFVDRRSAQQVAGQMAALVRRGNR